MCAQTKWRRPWTMNARKAKLLLLCCDATAKIFAIKNTTVHGDNYVASLRLSEEFSLLQVWNVIEKTEGGERVTVGPFEFNLQVEFYMYRADGGKEGWYVLTGSKKCLDVSLIWSCFLLRFAIRIILSVLSLTEKRHFFAFGFYIIFSEWAVAPLPS